MASCAGLQSQSAFWKFHDFFFENQPLLTESNFRDTVTKFAAGTPGLNVQRLLSCVDSGGSDEVLNRDEVLARDLGVRATPTIFINGVRGEPLRTIGDLEALLGRSAMENLGIP